MDVHKTPVSVKTRSVRSANRQLSMHSKTAPLPPRNDHLLTLLVPSKTHLPYGLSRSAHCRHQSIAMAYPTHKPIATREKTQHRSQSTCAHSRTFTSTARSTHKCPPPQCIPLPQHLPAPKHTNRPYRHEHVPQQAPKARLPPGAHRERTTGNKTTWALQLAGRATETGGPHECRQRCSAVVREQRASATVTKGRRYLIDYVVALLH